MRFSMIKSVACRIGADYGMQTGHQAKWKSICWHSRSRHVAIVAAAHAVGAITSKAGIIRSIAYVDINAGSHFVIDSFVMPKWIDAISHLIVAVISSRLLLEDK